MSSALPSYAEAAAIVAARAAQLAHSRPLVEEVDLAQFDLAAAASRILAEPLLADDDQPPFARSTRDGFACRASEINSHEILSLAGATRAGDAPAGPLPPGAAWEIMTGAPVPTGADAIVMLEHVEIAHVETTPAGIRLLAPRKISAGENIVPQAAQARRGDELLPSGTPINYAQIALAATCGYAALSVFARPKVAILTTGDELVPVNATPAPGQIRNSNAPMLAALVSAAGGDPWILPTANDNAESLDAALAQATQADLLLLSGGVSAGKFDLVEPALARIGSQFHFTGVRIQPGKPLVFGEVPKRDQHGAKCLFFGLPGNPVSSAVTFLLFAAPILAALAGSRAPAPRFALARLAAETDRRAKPGLTRFLPAFCTFNPPPGLFPSVELVPWQGSGDLAAQARANCFLVIPEDTATLQAGEIVQILLS